MKLKKVDLKKNVTYSLTLSYGANLSIISLHSNLLHLWIALLATAV